MRMSKIASKKKIIFFLSLLFAFFLWSISYVNTQNSIESQIIRLINQQCKEEGECYIYLPEITNFKWDKVSVFIAGGNWLRIRDALNLGYENIELQNGIVFSYNDKAVRLHTSFYDYSNDVNPRLSFWIERSQGDTYYKSYSRDNAILRAEKIKTSNRRYRYILYG